MRSARFRASIARLVAVGCGMWLLAISAPAADRFKGVFISEIGSGREKEGESGAHPARADWIELCNGSFDTLNLAGWFLSTSPTNLAEWRFPRAGIPPGGYLVLLASGNGQTNDLAHLQTNFRLSQNGGYLALVNPETNIVSELKYPKLVAGKSFGRVGGEPDITGDFSDPTPGKPNQTSGRGFATGVHFSMSSGSFLEPFTLELVPEGVSISSNVVIRYTLDGTFPGSSSRIYDKPLEITNTVWVRARAYGSGVLPGPPRSEMYVMLSRDLLRFRSNLPVLVMDTLGMERPTSGRAVAVHLSFYEPVNGATSFDRQPTLAARAGFHQRGSSSAGFPQPSFAVDFVDDFNREAHHSPLGLPANSDWVLYAPNQFDPIMIHNPFIHELSREMGHWSPRTRFVEVFLAHHTGAVTARDYFGIYVLEEKIKIGKHRVAIDRLGPEDLAPPAVTGGYLVKFDREGPGESGFWAGGASMVYVDPKESLIELPQRTAQKEYLQKYFDGFERVLRGEHWKDPERGYRAYVDVDSWIDFHVLEVLSGNVDIFRFSTFFYKPRGGKITFGPHWDFDRALGSIDQRDADPNRWNTGRFFDAPWWNRLFTDADFWQLWVDRWQELRGSTFSEAHLFELVDRLTGELRAAQPREMRRWDLQPRGDSYQSEIDWMKSWLSQRMHFIDEQLVQPPQITRSEDRTTGILKLTLSAAENSTILYTLDGSDPRLPQGGVSSNAVTYAGPIEPRAGVRMVARSRNPGQRQTGGPPLSTPWSRTVMAEFDVPKSSAH